MGKTAIARIIALVLHTRGWEAVDCRKADDVFKSFDRSRRQIFVADDAFGSTEYRPDIATEWAEDLDKLIRLMDRDHWLLWTSRPAPLREGLRQQHLQGEAESFPRPQEVEVNADKLSVQEKCQILYRHTRAAALGDEARELVRDGARRIVESDHFTPLRIRRFVEHDLRALLALSPARAQEALGQAIEIGLRAPTNAMATSFGVLQEDMRALLLVMLNTQSGPSDTSVLSSGVEAFLGRPSVVSVNGMVAMLDDHFIRRQER